MIRIAFAGVWVHDQDEALAFYTEKLGWELRADVTLPEFGKHGWITSKRSITATGTSQRERSATCGLEAH